jgi:TPR repeat protein
MREKQGLAMDRSEKVRMRSGWRRALLGVAGLGLVVFTAPSRAAEEGGETEAVLDRALVLDPQAPLSEDACRQAMWSTFDDADVAYHLALAHMGRRGIQAAPRNARSMLFSAARRGHSEAIREVGWHLLHGEPDAPRPDLALRWMIHARSKGFAIDDAAMNAARAALSPEEERQVEAHAGEHSPLSLPVDSVFYDRSQPFCRSSD